MSKVLIERPRTGGRLKTPKGYRRRTQSQAYRDELPVREPIRRCWQMTTREKDFSDLLGPLLRFLYSRVGSPWNEVYSEIRSHISPSSKMQLHLLGHVYDFVSKNVILIDGLPHITAKGGPAPVGRFATYNAFYVCPETGLLKLAPKVSSGEVKKGFPWQWADKTNLLIYTNLSGVWYEVKLGKVTYDESPQLLSMGRNRVYRTTYRTIHYHYDVILKRTLTQTDTWMSDHVPQGFYAVSKQQLNSTEIRRLNLRAA